MQLTALYRLFLYNCNDALYTVFGTPSHRVRPSYVQYQRQSCTCDAVRHRVEETRHRGT